MSSDGVTSGGPIALVGAGEYLPQMENIDLMLLQHVGGASARVVVLATASGLEPAASPERWAHMGVEHFARLGALAEPVNILAREDAFEPRWLALLEAADFIYFSGGNPQHVVDTLRGSPAWDVIRARHAAGAVLAGCSAGAMAFGGLTLQPRALWRGLPTVTQPGDAERWHSALGLVPRLIVLPHFDRLVSWMGREPLAQLIALVPAGLTLIGVDEDTALVCLEGSAAASGPSVWQVMGRQGVAVVDAEHGPVRHAAGATVVLDVGSTIGEPG